MVLRQADDLDDTVVIGVVRQRCRELLHKWLVATWLEVLKSGQAGFSHVFLQRRRVDGLQLSRLVWNRHGAFRDNPKRLDNRSLLPAVVNSV